MSAVISLSEIHKDYFLGKLVIPALRGVSLTIDRNEYVALMGPSGSGKSTLMNILGCLDTLTRGVYELDGIDVSRLQDKELARIRNENIGFVFQTFNLLPRLSAIENVALPLVYAGTPKRQRIEAAENVLEAVGLGDRMTHKPNELSGGQRQRVAVARALINNPSIILADEPTGNLDSTTSEEIMEMFQKINDQGNTVIIVTHEEEIARKTRRIIRLIDGRISSDQVHEPGKPTE